MSVKPMAVLPRHILPILALFCACMVGRTAAECANLLGDSDNTCTGVYDDPSTCFWEDSVFCYCAHNCNAPPFCSEVTENNDLSCTCPFNATLCDSVSQVRLVCPYTCALRDSVTCDLQMEVEGASTHINYQVTVASVFRYRDTAMFMCDPGWLKVTGHNKAHLRMCMADGSWVLHRDYQTPALVCARKSCGPVPPASTGSRASRGDGVFEDSVSYHCDDGYAHEGVGQGTHTCNASGQWQRTEPDPQCVPELVLFDYEVPEEVLRPFAKFVNSESEIQPNVDPASVALMPARARSNLHCASLCAADHRCHGYSFTRSTGGCIMNVGSPTPVVTRMKKLYG